MKFKNLNLINFQSYDKASIVFTDYKIIFITGINLDTGSSNGTGKSGIKEALFFLLSGKAKVKGPDLIRRGQKELKVSGTIEHNGKLIFIERTRKEQAGTLRLEIDGVDQKGRLEELQALLEKTLEITPDMFVTYAVIDRVRDTDLTKLSSTDLRLVLQDLLGLSRLQAVIEDFSKAKNGIESYLKKSHIKFYASNKRLNILKQGKESITEERSLIGNRVLEVTAQKAETEREIAIKESLAREYIVKKQELASQNTCPTCGHAIDIDKKLQQLNQIEDELQLIKEEVLKLKALLVPITPLLQDLMAKSKLLETKAFRCLVRLTQLEGCMQDQQNLDKEKAKFALYTTAIDVLQRYITNSLNTMVLKLEDSMNLELGKFSDLFCKINLTKTTASGLVNQTCSIAIFRGQHEYSFNMLSSGEQALLSLIFKIVISNLRGGINLLFVDEGLDALDETNRSRILSLLETSPYNQVFIISHREDAEHIRVGQKIALVKEHGITKVL